TVASVHHRLHDVFHGFAEEVNKQQVQQQHCCDHRAKQHEVVLAMKTSHQFATRTLVNERFDEATVLAIGNRCCYQPVLTIVAANLRRRCAVCDRGAAVVPGGQEI